MKPLALGLACIALLSASAQAHEFIYLVHGLLGWGPAELLGFPYWGQVLNYESSTGNFRTWLQTNTGLDTYVAAVGPISSNRERAVELYAQIRQQQADYGHVRSSTWSFTQLAPAGTSMDFSSTSNPVYTALQGLQSGIPIPASSGFCTAGNTDSVHLIGHSLGGPTIRMFERLIHQGDAAEMAWCTANNVRCNDLYNVTNRPNPINCIKTMTTIATLHDGSPLQSVLGATLVNDVKSLLLGIESALNGLSWFTSSFGFGSTSSLYNFDLDRLGSAYAINGASFTNYANTIFASGPLNNPAYQALAHYDLSPEFMLNFNQNGPLAYSTTHYFAAASGRSTTCGTYSGACACLWDIFTWKYDIASGIYSQQTSCGNACCSPSHQCPWSGTMELLLQPTSSAMGELTGGSVASGCWNNGAVHGSYSSQITFQSYQEENDGLVSRHGARGPNWQQASPTSSVTAVPTPPQPVPGTCPFGLGSGGFLAGGSSPTPSPVSCPTSSSNSRSDNAAWSSMSAGQWYYIDYAYDHMQMVGLFTSSWGSSAAAYGLPDGSAGGFFGLGAQPSGQGQLYKDITNFINTYK